MTQRSNKAHEHLRVKLDFEMVPWLMKKPLIASVQGYRGAAAQTAAPSKGVGARLDDYRGDAVKRLRPMVCASLA